MAPANCPVCQNKDGGRCWRYPPDGLDGSKFKCTTCGKYAISRTALCGQLDQQADALTAAQRACLSHALRTKHENKQSIMVDSKFLGEFLSDCRLPTPHERAANLIRYIGDQVSQTGESLPLAPDHLHAIIGATNREATIRLTKELVERNTLIADPFGTAVGKDPVTGRPISLFTNIDLSLDGWKQYEVEKQGTFAGNYGFLAMQFEDPKLEAFVQKILKPAVRDDLGYDLVDMRDVAKAGIIEVNMCDKIRNAKFVIVDLTHDNHGAYWEAGYAQALGKPVIYICEKEKFKAQKTHFDTNHYLTVPWSRDDDEGFRERLVAALRRSLDQSS